MNAGTRPPVDAWIQLPPRELVAVVQRYPAPDIPLASIRHLLRPLHDERGRLVDWLLFGSGFEDTEAVVQYRTWRATWRYERPIGSVAHLDWLRAEVAAVEHDLDDRILDRLLDAAVASGGERPVRVRPDEVAGLRAELATVRLALSVEERHGWGIVDDMPSTTRGHGLARTWAAPPSDLVLAGTPTSSVVLRPDGRLTIVRPDEVFEGVAAADLRHDTVVVLDDRGSSLRLTQDEARPLGWLVPRSLRWHVRQVPLVVVWALTLGGLTDALDALDTLDALDEFEALSGRDGTGEAMVIVGDAGVA